jgi:hypothetical protein
MATNTNYLVQIIQYGSPGSQPTTSVTAPIPEQVNFDVAAEYTTILPQSMAKSNLLNGAAQMLGMKLAVQAMTAQLWNGSTNGNLSMNLEFYTETDPQTDVRAPILALMKLATPSIHSTGLLQSPGPQLDFATLGSLVQQVGSNVTSSVSAIGTSLGNVVKNLANVTTGGTMSQADKDAMSANSTTTPAAQSNNPNMNTAAYWKNKVTNLIQIKIGNYLFFDNVIIERVGNVFTSNFDPATGLPHHVIVNIQFRPMFTLTQSDLDDIFLGAPNDGTTTGNNTYGFKIPDSVSGVGGGNVFSSTGSDQTPTVTYSKYQPSNSTIYGAFSS